MSEQTGEPGTEEAAEEPIKDGYGNDTGFARLVEDGVREEPAQEPAKEGESPGDD